MTSLILYNMYTIYNIVDNVIIVDTIDDIDNAIKGNCVDKMKKVDSFVNVFKVNNFHNVNREQVL